VALTVAWTVAVTTVLMCDVAAAAAHALAPRQEQPQSWYVLGELLLLAGAVAGALSLALLPLVRRVRPCSPPGFQAFSALASVAPMLALLVRALR
jgi:hypothetical protein